ncbi:MAG: CPBP family intramembrane glutamic endopeptidase [Cyanobacteriota bacterium]|nr:CPBP family intramembrane glutamic endopeptidase [Cyanobacteriota bacterium]
MTDRSPKEPEMETLSRTQILVAMGVTALVLLLIAKLWMKLGAIALLPIAWTPMVLVWALGITAFVTAGSALLYRFWPAYRESARFYLDLVLKPLVWPDLIWLGLLPGMSEELLFRGVMLPAVGLNPLGLTVSSLCFGVLHLSGKKQWPYMVWATVVGTILGLSALVTGNLLVPIVAHILTNFTSGLLWKLREKRLGTSDL